MCDQQHDVYQRVHRVLLGMPGAVAETPFGPDSLVFKVGGKMFAILYHDQDYVNVSLKVDPVEGELLRETWAAIIPGYHLNKRHWITAILDGTLPDDLVDDLIHDSCHLVVRGLTRAAREALPQRE
jgi:predicted DNA-binding protein (MmcQ/YjbR family)